MAAQPPNDWWQVDYHTVGGQDIHTGVATQVPGVDYVEAPDASSAKKKVASDKAIPLSQIDKVTGPMDPQTKDQAVGSNPIKGIENAVPNPFKDLSGIATAVAKVGAVFDSIGHAITDGKMWRSLGWVILGILLAGVGLSLWLKLPEKVEAAIGTVAGAAIKAP